jgi:hypothetical protein
VRHRHKFEPPCARIAGHILPLPALLSRIMVTVSFFPSHAEGSY